MNASLDPVTEDDLHAYVDGQLPGGRRLTVEDYLAARPDCAARVMADLRSCHALRLKGGAPAPVSPPTLAAARRLGRALVRQRIRRRGSRAAAFLLVAGMGWMANVGWASFTAPPPHPQPYFVDEAVMAHKMALVRAKLTSQPESPVYDAAEIGAATQIVLPRLPSGWRVLDVQLFPSDYGPSLQVTFDRGHGQPISLFAIRAHVVAPAQPSVVRRGRKNIAYWQEGDVAYALTGRAPKADLDRAAEEMANSLAI